MDKLLITGHEGYIGHVITENALLQGYTVVGLDVGLYREGRIGPKNSHPNLLEIEKDLRLLNDSDFRSFDLSNASVIHLAGLSNDPLGEFDEKLTFDINFEASKRLIDLCKTGGVSRFIFFSTQSVYGISQDDHEIEEHESGRLNPVTAYAKTKLLVENYLQTVADKSFEVIIFRPSTVFGPSRGFRSDIVFNNLTLNAYLKREVHVKSDGSPWRPVISVDDVSKAALQSLDKSLQNPIEVYNLGFPGGNFQVRDMAEIAAKSMGISKVIYADSLNEDPRTYKVSFKKFRNNFEEIYRCGQGIEKGGLDLKLFFDREKLSEKDGVQALTTRLAVLKRRIERGDINVELFKNEY